MKWILQYKSRREQFILVSLALSIPKRTVMPIARDVIVVKVRVIHVTARRLPQVKDGQGHFGVGQAFRKNGHVPLPCLKNKNNITLLGFQHDFSVSQAFTGKSGTQQLSLGKCYFLKLTGFLVSNVNHPGEYPTICSYICGWRRHHDSTTTIK